MDASKGEEADDCLQDRLGHADHAGGERAAHCRAHEVCPGEQTAGQDQQAEHGAEARVGFAETGSDLLRLPNEHWDSEEDGQGVEAADVQHLNSAALVDLGAALHEGEVAGLGEDAEPAHGVGVEVELEVAKGGHEGAQGDDVDAGGEEGGGEGLLEDDHREDEVDEGRAALDGAVHGDVHAMQGDEGQGGVEGEAEAAWQEVQALLQGVGRQLDHLEDAEEVEEEDCDDHLAGHDEEGVVELVAGDYGLVEEVHAQAADEIEARDSSRLLPAGALHPRFSPALLLLPSRVKPYLKQLKSAGTWQCNQLTAL